MVMSYKITMSLIDTPTVFNAMNKLGDHIALTLECAKTMEDLLPALKKDYGIIVSEPEGYVFTGHYDVEFPSEQDYLIFLLKWT
jgi:hypothetical protein